MSPESTMKYCRTCGKQVMENASACLGCGVPPRTGNAFCNHCGNKMNLKAIVCVACGASAKSKNLPNAQLIIAGWIALVTGIAGQVVSILEFVKEYENRAYRMSHSTNPFIVGAIFSHIIFSAGVVLLLKHKVKYSMANGILIAFFVSLFLFQPISISLFTLFVMAKLDK